MISHAIYVHKTTRVRTAHSHTVKHIIVTDCCSMRNRQIACLAWYSTVNVQSAVYIHNKSKENSRPRKLWKNYIKHSFSINYMRALLDDQATATNKPSVRCCVIELLSRLLILGVREMQLLLNTTNLTNKGIGVLLINMCWTGCCTLRRILMHFSLIRARLVIVQKDMAWQACYQLLIGNDTCSMHFNVLHAYATH